MYYRRDDYSLKSTTFYPQGNFSKEANSSTKMRKYMLNSFSQEALKDSIQKHIAKALTS